MTNHPLDSSLVRIIGVADSTVGWGLLVARQHVVTSAHTVAKALNMDSDLTQPPVDILRVDFPLLGRDGHYIRARVLREAWLPPQPQGGGDMAGLELLDPIPVNAVAQKVVQASTLWGHSFQVFGFSTEQNKELWIEGHIQGNLSFGWAQITCSEDRSIQTGFEGTPVWDSMLDGVVGMVVAGGTSQQVGYMIPTRTLMDAWALLSEHSLPPFETKGEYHFISYSRTNKPLVERLIVDLGKRGINVWIDKQGLKAGTRNWEQALRDAISGSTSVLFVASPESRRSDYVQDELSIAEMYRRPVYPVWIFGEYWIDCIPLGRGKMQYIDMRGEHYDDGLQELIQTLTNTTSSISIKDNEQPASLPIFRPRNPYKGLRSFETLDSADFFGRENFIASLNEHLDHSRFLAVIGASGSGKSSVIKAGLIPILERVHRDWTVLPEIVPSMNPLERLSLTLAEKYGGSIVDIRKDLDTIPDSRGLHLRVAMGEHKLSKRVILFIDQFEELFTLTTSEDERQHFLDLITTAVSEPDGMLSVVLTMRADFDDRPMAYNELMPLFEANRKIIPPLTLTDLRDIIEKPAALPDVKVVFDDNLVAELVFEVRDQIGGLPLLQFTLDQLFEHCKNNSERRLTFTAYREIGGLRGALTKHAEQTYAALPSEEHRTLSRALFLRLVELGPTEQDITRRRALDTELDFFSPVQTAIMHEVYDAFVRARLLTINEAAGLATIEVSHEALIQEWPRLHDWVRNARQDVQFQKQLAQDVASWVMRGRKKNDDGLYRGLVLINAQDWTKRNVPSTEETAFIDASAQWQQQVIVAEERRKQELRQAEEAARRAQYDAEEARKRAESAERNAAILIEKADRKREAAAFTAAGVEFLNRRDPNPELASLFAIQSLRREYSQLADETLLSAAQWPYSRIVIPVNFQVSAMAVSSDSKVLAVGGQNVDVLLIDISSGHVSRTLQGHENYITSLAFSPSGELVATGSLDGTLRIWSAVSGLEIHRFFEEDYAPVSIAYAPNGRWLAVGSMREVHIWDIEKGIKIQTLHIDRGTVWATAFSPDSRLVTGGGDDRTVYVWETESWFEERKMLGHEDIIYGVSFSPDGKHIGSGSNDNTVRLWDLADGTQTCILAGHTNRVRSVGFSPDSQFLISGSEDNTVRIWQTENGNTIRVLSAHTNAVMCVAYTNDGSRIISGSNDQTLRVWDSTPTQDLLRVFQHPNWVWDVSISPDGKNLVTGSEDGEIRIWELATGRQTSSFRVSHARAISAVYSADGTHIFTGGADGSGRLLNAETGQEKLVVRGHESDVWCGALSVDGRFAATGGEDSKAIIWDIASGKSVRVLRGHVSSIWDISFSADGKYLVTGSSDTTARVWEIQSGNLVQELIGHTNGLWGSVFSPDGRFVLTGGYDQTARIWDWKSGKLVCTLVGHTNGVRAVAYSPDGKLVATASDDGTARLWDAFNGNVVRILRGHSNRVLGITFSPDGKLLATAGEDGIARIWDVDINDLVNYVCSMLPRDLPDDLRKAYGVGPYPTCPQFGTATIPGV